MSATRGTNNQPVSSVQWVPRDSLHSNVYNPNAVAPPELRLLKISILEDGWTQPVVAYTDGEIVDGFHRWTLSADPEIADLTGGLVPVVFVSAPLSQRMMSTIRHNRARGIHGVLKMADLVRHLKDQEGLEPAEIQRRLGMEDEEFERLYDRATQADKNKARGFSKGWVPR